MIISSRDIISQNSNNAKSINNSMINNTNFNGNNDIINEEDYQILNKKYFHLISFLQKELCQKELEIQFLIKENKELKAKMKK